MPIPLKPPSRVDPLNFPVFGISWFANPGNGLSLVAYCGGGGSAKTGVNNFILVRAPDGEARKIETGVAVGVAVKIVQNPISSRIFLMVALGKGVERYNLPSCDKSGEIEVGGDGVNAIAVNNVTSMIACGCETGEVKVYEIGDDSFDAQSLLYVCDGHTKAICSIDFSCRGGRMVSSAKDGTARVWQGDQTIAELTCSVEGRAAANRPVQVMVRGCAFGDLDGKCVFTVASSRRGSAFLARWVETPEGLQCERTECSGVPISAMSLSSDGSLLALGSVEGSIILWGVDDWKPLKTFVEVHDLPVTCIAARPFDTNLQGEDDGIKIHAISASADSRLAHLTLQRRGPKQSKPGAFTSLLATVYNLMLWLAIAYVVMKPITEDAQEKCGCEWRRGTFAGVKECFIHEVLWAPSSYHGVLIPPH